MKRFALSILGGVFVPSLYVVVYCALAWIAFVVFHLWRSPGFHRMAESLGPILLRPVSWPSGIYFHFFPPDREFVIFSGFEFGNLLFLAVGNFALYAALTYFFLSIVRKGSRQTARSKMKKLFVETQSLPQVQALTDDDILREV